VNFIESIKCKIDGPEAGIGPSTPSSTLERDKNNLVRSSMSIPTPTLYIQGTKVIIADIIEVDN
jgi:hypothetical protein